MADTALVSDTRIAGTPDDFMQVRHLVFRGSHRSIGSALGAIAQSELGVDKTAAWSDPVATASQAQWLAQRWPEHLERARGAADAFGAHTTNANQDFAFLYYDWAVPGCSNCFWPGATTADGHNILSRNYDFTTGTVFELMGQPIPPGMRAATARPFLIETHPIDGYRTLTMTSYELLGGALDGMNSAGLGIALMATTDALRGGAPPALHRNAVGLSEVQLIRFLLERAGSVAEAWELLQTVPQYTMWVPCHFLLADTRGESLLWSHEVAESPVATRGRTDRPVCATNHVPEHVVAEIPQRAESVERLARLQSAATKACLVSEGVTREAIVAANRSVAAALPPGQGQYQAASPARTLWHSVYDLDARSLAIDFYLGEGPGGIIRRSPYMDFTLAA